MIRRLPGWIIALLLLSRFASLADTLHVHALEGDDTRPGSPELPLKTIQKALSKAKPGDTVLLMPGQPPIHESILLNHQSGEPGKPIVIDGGGNVLRGARPIQPDDWTEVSPGVYRCERLLPTGRLVKGDPKRNASTISRYFFLMDGGMNRMGRSSKGAKPPLPNVADLKPGEWTFVDDEAAFYIAIEEGKTLAELKIESPVLQDGLATRGQCSHWRIRNVNVQHFINDGFNFHGVTQDFKLENISATECGDDGMSAHGECQVKVRGFTSRRNSTGICHINQSSSENADVRLEENYGVNLYLLGSGTHNFTNSVISANGQGIRIGGKGDSVRVTLKDCTLSWPDASLPDDKPPLSVAPGCDLQLLGSTKVGPWPIQSNPE